MGRLGISVIDALIGLEGVAVVEDLLTVLSRFDHVVVSSTLVYTIRKMPVSVDGKVGLGDARYFDLAEHC